MEEFRDFDEGHEPPGPDAFEGGPSFALRGQKFRCLPDPPPWVRFELVYAAETNNLNLKIAAVIAFLRGVLHPGDELAFIDVMRNKTDPVDHDTLMDLFVWLRTQYLGSRPTRRPSGSAGGPPTESPTSEDDSVSPGSTSEPSVSESSST